MEGFWFFYGLIVKFLSGCNIFYLPYLNFFTYLPEFLAVLFFFRIRIFFIC